MVGTSTAGALPKVLALHGFRTSGSILQQQVTIAGLREFFKDRLDITFLDGPHPAAGPPAADVAAFFQPPFNEWWNVSVDPVTGVRDYTGCAHTLEFVAQHMRQHGPYVGLMGFSQGATLAGLVSLMQRAGQAFQDVPPLQFLVLISGSINLDPRYQPLYQAQVQTPALLIIGDKDIQRANHDAFVECVADPLVLRHARGHLVPRLSSEQQQQLDAFIAQHTGQAAAAAAAT